MDYRYWKRNKIKVNKDHPAFNEESGFDDYSLLLELEEGAAVVETCRFQGLVDYTHAELEPDTDEGDVMSENMFEYFFMEVTDEKELGLLLLQLTGD